MPHYKDNTKAKVGDIVKGKPFDGSSFIVAPVIRIIEGTESCNLTVGPAIQVHEADGNRVVILLPNGGYTLTAGDAEKVA
jgi:hypothetical protein